MNRVLLSLSFAAAIAAWSPASFAQLPRQQIGTGTTQLGAGGAGPTAYDGSAYGVDMTGAATLNVGPAPLPSDIFTTNTSLSSPTPAVTTGAASFGNVVFLGNSNVYGAIGTTGNFLLGVYGGATVAGVGQVVNFYGPVFTTTTYVSGTGTLNFLSPGTNLSSGGLIFQGDGTISLAPNTTVVGAITTTAGTNTGTLSLGSGSVLNGAVGAGSTSLRAINVVGGSNTAGVTASISGAVNAYSFSLGTNTLLWGIHLTGAGCRLGRWNVPMPAPTTLSLLGSSRLGSRLTQTAWTT